MIITLKNNTRRVSVALQNTHFNNPRRLVHQPQLFYTKRRISIRFGISVVDC